MSLPKVSVQPGQVYLARRPMILQTILGSCVSATFWNSRLGFGALCHGILPCCPPDPGVPEGHRYVDFAIRFLAAQFDALGIRRGEIEVKLFGGADVLQSSAARIGRATVGAMNCRTALEVLAEEGLTVIASDLGGTRGRTIHFNTASGIVLARRLNSIVPGGEFGLTPLAGPRMILPPKAPL